MQNTTNHIKRELQLTADGSHTLFIPEMDEHYHSVNGAVQESRHVFIEAGLHHLERREITILEIGFGTGLNAFLTLLDAEACQRKIHYCSIELYPLGTDVIESLNYGEMLCAGRKDVFHALHQAEWNLSLYTHLTLPTILLVYDRRWCFDDLLCERCRQAYDERSRVFC